MDLKIGQSNSEKAIALALCDHRPLPFICLGLAQRLSQLFLKSPDTNEPKYVEIFIQDSFFKFFFF